MQVVAPSSPASKFAGKERFSEVYGELNDDFGSKLKISSTEEENRDKDEEEREEEFSFASVNAENSPITAEEAFEGGQIRPVYPLFNRNIFFDDPKEETLRSPLKKLFVESTTTEEEEEEEESETVGPYCSWTNRTVEEASPETCRKSNSTGFSKLWRFRDLVLRSNSDGKDAFVFLSNGSSSSSSTSAKLSGVKSSEKGKETTKTEKKKKMRTKSAHEKLYMRNRAMREEGKRRSYLPYQHVGFFTNVNGLTRNVHPF
ncbi:unnamed protein product [Arabidopsis lyrata]|uniref:Uncharacterized protein n=1 Tax=Arabidopsis lyrata subsp. lyrata TaxID=81972 RepID=D7KY25_ARALL|nr:uncharacterized protein LOC9324842 [Arabidopsis lyrata subsp. lyrata]EFH65038.1 hypothetical protein ARALYDRAFT_476162 [Arabidopsis lyrata subsp. lyrata]CAH8257719.1 unnamed protein product [Arabidopsis lyrata]|eukprot:XP_020865903.1 uncharacterized protein LOC9324842 [Arabidopsis lyrata subsp. lyrata]